MSPIIDLRNFSTFTAINLLSDPGYDKGKHPIPNCIQVNLGWGQDDTRGATIVLGAQVAPTFTPTVAIANAILTGLTTGAAWTALAAFMPTTSGLFGVSLRDRRVIDQPFITATAAGAVGTSASPALPSETAAVVTFRTANAGRGHRGRMYVPNWATNALGAGNLISAGAVTALGNWANTIGTVFTGQNMTHALIQPHRLAYTSPKGTPHDERPAGVEVITARIVRDNHWDTQRRRGLK